MLRFGSVRFGSVLCDWIGPGLVSGKLVQLENLCVRSVVRFSSSIKLLLLLSIRVTLVTYPFDGLISRVYLNESLN